MSLCEMKVEIGGSFPFRVVRVLMAIALICCAPICGETSHQTCGKRQVNTMFLMHRGVASQPGHWPWHAAIFLSFGNPSRYACGGTIINSRTILSSAHCFVTFNRLINAELITVHVGQMDVNETTDDVQALNVSKLLVHPEFNIRNGVAHDIGILKLSTEIVFTRFVQPVCVWDMNDDLDQLVGKNGSVVGFGLDENDQLPGMLKEATLTVVSNFECIASDREIYEPILTPEHYCARGKKGVSPCNGDVGGGMFFERNGTWFVRGVISFIPVRLNDPALCDSSKIAVFTDISKYRGWLMQSIQEATTPSRLS